MNRIESISKRILDNANFENVAHVCCDWEEFVFEVAEWGVDHIATIDFDTLTPDEIKQEVVEEYMRQKGKSRQHLLNYFVKFRLKNMMEVLDDF